MASKTIRTEIMPATNSTYPKVAVQWLNQTLCFYQSLCLADSEVLRNRHLRVAANRYRQVYERNAITSSYTIKKNICTDIFKQKQNWNLKKN